jgi:hypothetical protein
MPKRDIERSHRCRRWSGRWSPIRAEKIGPAQEKGSEMKHIMGTALRVTGCLVLAITGVALLAGQDDIRKFRRMHSM